MPSEDSRKALEQNNELGEMRIALLTEVRKLYGSEGLVTAQDVLREMPVINSADFNINEFYRRLELKLKS